MRVQFDVRDFAGPGNGLPSDTYTCANPVSSSDSTPGLSLVSAPASVQVIVGGGGYYTQEPHLLAVTVDCPGTPGQTYALNLHYGYNSGGVAFDSIYQSGFTVNGDGTVTGGTIISDGSPACPTPPAPRIEAKGQLQNGTPIILVKVNPT